MKPRIWMAVTLAGILAMALLTAGALAKDAKKARSAGEKKAEAATMKGGMPGCAGMAGGKEMAAPRADCGMGAGKAESGKACGSMKGAMGGMEGCGKGAGMGTASCGHDMAGGKCAPGMGGGNCCAGMAGGKCGPGMGAGMCGHEQGKGMGKCGPGMGASMCGPGMGRGMRPGMGAGMCGPDMGLGCGPGMAKELGLSPEQQKKVADICEAHQKLVIQNRADVQLAELDLRRLMGDPQPDKARIEAQLDKLGALRTQFEKSRADAMIDMRSVLTPEQLKKWHAGGEAEEEDED